MIDTVTVLFIYRGSSMPHVVEIERQYLPLVIAASKNSVPFRITGADGIESTIHPRALARVMVVEGEGA